MSQDVLTETQNGVLTITLNRPAKKNALTAAMYAAVADALAAAQADAAIRVVVLTGAGGAFTAGNDLNDFLSNPPRGEETPVARFLRGISTFEKPLIAAVAGVAVGVGTTLLLHCDLVYAAPSARLQLPFVNLALVPEAASSLLLPRLVGHQKAAELFYFGEAFDAETAQQLGIVNAVVAEDQLLAHAQARAALLAKKAPTAMKLAKQLMRQPAADVPTQMAAESVHFGNQLKSTEAREAMTAFFEKRTPNFG